MKKTPLLLGLGSFFLIVLILGIILFFFQKKQELPEKSLSEIQSVESTKKDVSHALSLEKQKQIQQIEQNSFEDFASEIDKMLQEEENGKK